ncbi:MAG: tetratricopeptide repeat protein [Raineya sp.]|nr:tetratricopeptide repeat protein [Raineya sp.]
MFNATDKEKISAYENEAQKLREQNPPLALTYAQKALTLAEKIQDTASMAYNHTLVGVLYKNMGDYDKAIMHYTKAIPLNKAANNPQGNAGIYNNLAFVYRLQGRYSLSLDYYLKALEFFEKDPKFAKQKSNVLNNIGSLYQDQKNYEKALDYFNQSLEVAKQIGDTLGIAFAYNNMGEVYLKQDKFQEAKQNFFTSLVWKKQKKHIRSIASGYGNLGLVYQQENKLDSALYYFQESLKNYEKIKDLNGQIDILLRLGEFWDKQDKHQNAFENYQKALQLSLQIGAKPLTQQAYKFLSQYYAEQKDFQKAFELRLQYDNIKDSLINVEQVRTMNEMQAKYDDYANKQQIELLKSEKKVIELQNRENQRQKVFLFVGIAVLTILLLGVLWAFRLKGKTAKKLAEKNQIIAKSLEEKEMLLKEIHHRVKNNLQVISSLLHLQGHHGGNPDEVIKKSQDRIQAMAIIHEKLYKSENLQSISLAEYVENLIAYFEKTYGLQEKNIRLETNVEPIFLDIDRLIPCGLILNEIITNSIKYAFNGQNEGVISIEATLKNGTCQLILKDNGKGLPEDFTPQKSKSLGLRLVDGLVRQIKGSWQVSNELGAKFFIQFEPMLKVA